MSEFSNRISAQRVVLTKINEVEWEEELFGLSSGAIDRWVLANKIQENSELLLLVHEVAEKLFFLANKSQEQITEEYKSLSSNVSVLTSKIGNAVKWSYDNRKLDS